MGRGKPVDRHFGNQCLPFFQRCRMSQVPTPPPPPQDFPQINITPPPTQRPSRPRNQSVGIFNRYMRSVGRRSFICQCLILAWTGIMIMFSFGSCLFMWPSEMAWQLWENDLPSSGVRSWQTLSFCCPISLWFIVVLPVLIAAIVTMKREV